MKPKFLLQLGLAFVLIYAGSDALIHPSDWIGYVPSWVSGFGLSIEILLKLHASTEILLGIALLSGWQLRLFAALAAADIFVILVMNGFNREIFLATFRDVSILFTAIFLALDQS